MFRCCSLETSRPRLLPQSPKDCSINLCLFFCSAYNHYAIELVSVSLALQAWRIQPCLLLPHCTCSHIIFLQGQSDPVIIVWTQFLYMVWFVGCGWGDVARDTWCSLFPWQVEIDLFFVTGSQSVQSLSHVQLFVTPWTAALQASLSITNSWSLLKFMSIELVMPSNHLILCCPLLLLPSIFPSIRVFSNESVLCIRWPKY